METPAEEIRNGPAQGNAPELRLTGCQFEKISSKVNVVLTSR
jgi:hypothetical protein